MEEKETKWLGKGEIKKNYWGKTVIKERRDK